MKQESWTAEQFREHNSKQQARNAQSTRLKYGNIWTEVDGIKFQSILEADYYGKLKLRKRANDLVKFERQKRYEFIINGISIGAYVADFVIWENSGAVTVVDTKSAATEAIPFFQMKKALMLALFSIDVKIVKSNVWTKKDKKNKK